KKPEPETLAQILSLKREINKLKRSSFSQREKISLLAKSDYKFITKKSKPYFRDVYDHMIRVSDSIENHRDSLSEAFNAYMSAVSNNMNEVMKVLSIIATIALPLTVISGIYGTNFIHLPGSKLYFGFWIMIFFMIIMVFAMIFYFKKRKWV
ncbi:magnesium and cobalt transport protein CorA, partial [Candidatus Woesearchaeota archaeon]|nr:magnesium and cobalt transport protein CorA [Candidatus Woesearchaeota archaeon]